MHKVYAHMVLQCLVLYERPPALLASESPVIAVYQQMTLERFPISIQLITNLTFIFDTQMSPFMPRQKLLLRKPLITLVALESFENIDCPFSSFARRTLTLTIFYIMNLSHMVKLLIGVAKPFFAVRTWYNITIPMSRNNMLSFSRDRGEGKSATCACGRASSMQFNVLLEMITFSERLTANVTHVIPKMLIEVMSQMIKPIENFSAIMTRVQLFTELIRQEIVSLMNYFPMFDQMPFNFLQMLVFLAANYAGEL